MLSKRQQTKWIIVTGGVLSGLGKGIAAASIGHLLHGKKVIPIKNDGYLNVDPGTMNPIEHGEVFVLDDGGEVDMDFGHYERFLNINCKFEWNLTMGKVFELVRKKERRGDYLGKTVQLIPHVSDLIKDWWTRIAAQEKAQVMLVEIGGTVGDMENELFLEAARQLRNSVGKENMLFVHVTYVPIPHGVFEQKSKPTQQSVHLLLERGIKPDIIIGRCSELLRDSIKNKIAAFCDVDKNAVITGLDVDNVYKIPFVFEKEGIGNILSQKLGIKTNPNKSSWRRLLYHLDNPKTSLNIAICGKYTKLEDSYASIIEALKHCEANYSCKINVKWIETTDVTNDLEAAKTLRGIDGVIVPGGFGSRGVEGKIKIIKHCRKHNIAFLGLCLGLQLAVVEYARNVCQLKNAHTTEVDSASENPVIDLLPGQRTIKTKGATMRLGSYRAILKDKSLVKKLYNNKKEVFERHRHRYEVNPKYHEILQKNGLILCGMSPDGRLVEFIELAGHKYFVATQSHPELKSRLQNPAPLFSGFIKAILHS
ncbi:CTP synthase (glutamine hydrolyzing) [Candidatus Woesearchaeota archaeon]|nr:CTP synthase (glutamine hydrolyzing) [Candidatus Woesearchaeota archaeon]